MSTDTNQNSQNPEYSPQPISYDVHPNQLDDEINFGAFFSKVVDQWKLILGLTLGGTILAVLLALKLPSVYQPAVTVSLPLPGDVVTVTTFYTLMSGKGNELPASPQAIFTNYFNLLRSDVTLGEFVHEKKYLEKLYPSAAVSESVLLAKLLKGWNVKIKEPIPEKRGGYIANPVRVEISINVEDEAIGAELLNSYSKYVNKKLITNLQNDVRKDINSKAEVLSKQIAILRKLYKQKRVLNVEKMEISNAKKIALLEEEITAFLDKSQADRATTIANTKEALAMAQSLDINYPTTLDALAQQSQKGKSVNTAITVVDKMTSSLYLQGEIYLTTLIETLEKRKSDEKYLARINNLREKIHLIKNDKILASLKNRETDDPWIEGLSEKLTQLTVLKTMAPDFMSLTAYNIDKLAMITDLKIKPKRKLIVIIGFFLSFIAAIFIVYFKDSIVRKKSDNYVPL